MPLLFRYAATRYDDAAASRVMLREMLDARYNMRCASASDYYIDTMFSATFDIAPDAAQLLPVPLLCQRRRAAARSMLRSAYAAHSALR